MKIQWRTAHSPLPAVAVVAAGHLAQALEDKTASREDLQLTRFAEWSVVEGPDLPWVDGAVYLGPVPGSDDLLVPVHRLPDVHPDLVRRAARSLLAGRPADRVGVLPVADGVVVFPLGSKP